MNSSHTTERSRILFIRRTFPSANMVLIKGDRPILIDTGYGSDIEETVGLVREHGVAPEELSLIVNTHYHSDHAGGNYGFQSRYGTPIAAHEREAAMINARDPEACSGRWLDQPVEPYRVDVPLDDGDLVGDFLRVVHTPGHTLGHIALYDEQGGNLICGDAVHADDVCWLDSFCEGADVLERATEPIERLAALKPRWSCSGHGPDTDDPGAVLARALERYAGWREDPKRMGWHACKRIFAYRLMIVGGLERGEVEPYLLRVPWYADYATQVFGVTPERFLAAFMDEMIRSKAAKWDGDRLIAGAPHTVPAPDWQQAPGDVAAWPPL